MADDEKFLNKLKIWREKVDWKIETQRYQLLLKLYPVIRRWWRQKLPDLRDIFRPEEIEWIIVEELQRVDDSDLLVDELIPFVDFVNKTGYKDVPEVDEDGQPLSRRTTPVHRASTGYISSVFIPEIFKIYNGCEVNYIDERGITHFHLACKYGCYEEVKKFLEFGLDPNRLARDTDLSLIDPPLHLAAHNKNRDVFQVLLRRGADPNLVDKNGSTALHIVCDSGYVDSFMVEMLFLLSNEKYQPLLIDARDDLGRTPLKLAVMNLASYVVDLLLNRGADLSDFVFPTEELFNGYLDRLKGDVEEHIKLKLVSGMLSIVMYLENKEYELNRSDVITIIKLFTEHKVFKKLTNLDYSWCDDEEFTKEAKKKMLCPDLSLYDLVQLPPEEAYKLLIYFTDYVEFVGEACYWTLPEKGPGQAYATYLCAVMAREFCKQWALEFFLTLTHHQLPILCCEKIIEQLSNGDLMKICLTADIVPEEQSKNM